MSSADNSKVVLDYINDVTTNGENHCKWVKLAVKRHLKDLKKGKKRGIYFDEDSANRIINFFKILKFTKGKYAKQPFILEPFQMFRYWVMFGWKRKDGTRRFRKVYTEVARKNGKSEEGGGFADYMLMADHEEGAEVYAVATKKEQAKIVFEVAKKMAIRLKSDSPALSQRLGTSVGSVFDLETGSKIEPLAANSEKQDGLDPHAAIIDEYHAHKNSDLLEVVETGMGAREQPMLFVITTAGFNKEGPCYKLRKVVCDILEGKKTDDSTFGIIYTLDEEDDWKDETKWIKANPNIGRTPNWNYMHDQFTKAINEGVTKEVQFKTKNLNIWTSSSMAWLNDETWMKCTGTLPDLTGKLCYGGLDLAATSDSNAFSLVFPEQEGLEKRCSLHYFWMPEAAVERKMEIADYKQWATDGFIKTTEGDVIDHRFIIKDIIDILKKYQVKAIAFDRFLAYHGVVQELMDESAPMVEFGQGYKSMSPPTKEMEKIVKAGELNHGGNPVMRWMVGNVVLTMNPAEDIKMDKSKAGEKIDGPVSLVMALGMEQAKPDIESGGSIYDSQEVVI